MAALSTRLLVLGVVRIFQPVHGYFVRRELLSWQANEWAAVNPGSIYGQLKTLTRDAYLEELLPGPGGGNVRYRLTADGDELFDLLLRKAFWQVDVHDPSAIMAGIALSTNLPREDVLEALEARENLLKAEQLKARTGERTELGEPLTHARELWSLSLALIDAQLSWTRSLRARVRAGEYAFAGEPTLAQAIARMHRDHRAELAEAQRE